MFWKKKALTDQVSNTKRRAFFANHSPFLSFKPIDYYIKEDLFPKRMLSFIEKKVNALPTNIDVGNANALDSTIFSMLIQSEVELYKQYIEHQDIARRIALRRDADFENFKLIAKTIEDDIAFLKGKLEEAENGGI